MIKYNGCEIKQVKTWFEIWKDGKKIWTADSVAEAKWCIDN